jgi:ATP-binding cassette, subfamily B, bacterial
MLSGGQRQRLCIARAVLKAAPILLLDEATSAVDNETGVAIQRSLTRVARGRTIIAIAHRLSTIRHADRICVMNDRGGLAEEGRHEDLLLHEGPYAALWRVQTGAADLPASAGPMSAVPASGGPPPGASRGGRKPGGVTARRGAPRKR